MQPVKCFYSYAHADKSSREMLSRYLAPLRQQKKIEEWYDRNIEPGANWNQEISEQIASADLIFFLLSADFLASDYCFGVEVEQAFRRLKNAGVKIVPVLVKPCLWDQSRFSEIQIIPRDGKPIGSAASADDAFFAVAEEIKNMVTAMLTAPAPSIEPEKTKYRFDNALNLVRVQVSAYAGLYERIRQHMQPGDDRTRRMQEVFEKMKKLAYAAYPFLEEMQQSPLPGEHLMAIAILHEFVNEDYFDYLIGLVGSEKPFAGYQAAKALQIAAASVSPRSYPKLQLAVAEANQQLALAAAGLDSGRRKILADTAIELEKNMKAFSSQ